jgi:hypothetical protein
MNKAQTLLDPSSCLNKATPDEPLFVLRAKDPTAPQAIRQWAAMNDGIQPAEKVAQALAIAEDMDDWRARHQVAAPLPQIPSDAVVTIAPVKRKPGRPATKR